MHTIYVVIVLNILLTKTFFFFLIFFYRLSGHRNFDVGLLAQGSVAVLLQLEAKSGDGFRRGPSERLQHPRVLRQSRHRSAVAEEFGCERHCGELTPDVCSKSNQLVFTMICVYCWWRKYWKNKKIKNDIILCVYISHIKVQYSNTKKLFFVQHLPMLKTSLRVSSAENNNVYFR